MLRPWMLGHHEANPYFRFTDACNADSVRVILSSGQACVWYRLTLASKDGDWIIRPSTETCQAVLAELARWGAGYRLGAPLDPRWLAAGWSAHFESLTADGLRLRFDFVSHPPRLASARLDQIWRGIEAGATAVLPPGDLIPIKQTMRLKDYPFIGALASRLPDPADRLRTLLDAESLITLLDQHPEFADRLAKLRPALAGQPRTVEAFGAALDAEIRRLRATDERRIQAYAAAMAPWTERFRNLSTNGTLREVHERMCAAAHGVLPTESPAIP